MKSIPSISVELSLPRLILNIFEHIYCIFSNVPLPRATTVVASASMTYIRKFSVKETLTAELSEG